MFRKLIITVVGLFLVVGGIAGVKAKQIGDLIKMGESMQMPPQFVSSFEVKESNWESTISAVGSLEAAKGVEITADLPGRVDKIFFEAGAMVEAGDLLLQQDVSSERAQLRASQAQVALAKNNLDRAEELWGKRVISKADYDTAIAQYDSAVAESENVQTNIEKKSIYAPFSGKLGIRRVNLGQDINDGQPIVSLQASDLMFVNFLLPQQEIASLKVNLPVRVSTDAAPDKIFDGLITAISPEIDQATRSIRVQATLENKSGELLPGMFTSIEVVLDAERVVKAVPITAIAYATFGDSVYVIEEKRDENNQSRFYANQQFVQLGEMKGDFVQILNGLELGQVIADAGLVKLSNGIEVAVNNDIKPEFSEDPKPADK